MWGENSSGGLGDNTIINRSSPVQVGSATDWNHFSASYVVSQALKTDGTLWAYGRGEIGELGQNDGIARSSPVQIPGTWTTINSKMVGGSGIKRA